MPLWTCSLRTLAYRWPNKSCARLMKGQRQWPIAPTPWRNYSGSLQERQRDDTNVAPLLDCAGRPNKSPNVAFVSSLYDHSETTTKRSHENEKQPLPHKETEVTEPRTSKTLQRRKRATAVPPLEPPTTNQVLVSRAQRPGECNQRRASRTRRKSKRDRQQKAIPPKSLQALPTLTACGSLVTITKRHYTGRLRRHLVQQTAIPRLDVRTFEWVDQVLDHLDEGHQTVSKRSLSFLHGRVPTWNEVWTNVAIWLLTYDPKRMLAFLLATHAGPHVQTTYIEDSLVMLARYWARAEEPERTAQLRELADVFCVLAERKGEERLCLSNPSIRTLITYCTDEQVDRIYQTIKAQQVRIFGTTYLHFATYFARHDRFLEALDALSNAKTAGANVNGYGFRSNCSTLLRKSITEPDGLRVCLRVVSDLVDMGVQLNNQICNIVMLNAVEAGDLETAFSIYRSLKERGLQPDAHTFAVLLQGCKMDIDDVETLNDTIRDAIGNVNVRHDGFVATQILHCLALHHSKHNPESALSILTEAYAQLFDLEPLQKLGLPLPKTSQQRLSTEQRIQPTAHPLTFMIGASAQHILTHGVPLKEILAIYERWREAVEAGDPALVSLATTDHVANIFLTAFIRSPSGLIHAARVVRDMQRPLPSTAGVDQTKPTVQTWSIFLHGFTRHGKTKLAEQVLDYMRSQGIQPNLVTWNTLVTGYARAQDMGRTLDALDRAQQSGMVWDEWTYGALKGFRDRETLQRELERRRLVRKLDFSEDLKVGIGERLRRVEGEEGSGFSDSPGELAELEPGSEGRYTPFAP